ncbi:hypothetical protein GRS48_13615 [Halorubrum sp. JWXQ-INN 858]|uniref:hypothetical protein n=1 Tax=Halorubrum sp. JWXQ-INN 858 TaxID=2690782 RepID=UPI001359FD89|nr:hypothetical protein [Halorubrum sp. JWXQ-INN 858]MWV65851.1 hypothetical protein [Halorubrum sp. JWXQ-INN 858]
MAIEEASTFDCPDCEATAPSTAVPYDTLGYAVCPSCDHVTGPSTGRADDAEGLVDAAEGSADDAESSTDDAAWWVE